MGEEVHRQTDRPAGRPALPPPREGAKKPRPASGAPSGGGEEEGRGGEGLENCIARSFRSLAGATQELLGYVCSVFRHFHQSIGLHSHNAPQALN
jgi:hypothetical protein